MLVHNPHMHSTSEVLSRLYANTDPQRDTIFTRGPAEVLDPGTSEIRVGTKLGFNATHKLPGGTVKPPQQPPIQIHAAAKAKADGPLT